MPENRSDSGVFLLPLMEEFPQVQVTSLDLLDKRVTFLNELAAGGYSQLTAYNHNICGSALPGGQLRCGDAAGGSGAYSGGR